MIILCATTAHFACHNRCCCCRLCRRLHVFVIRLQVHSKEWLKMAVMINLMGLRYALIL